MIIYTGLLTWIVLDLLQWKIQCLFMYIRSGFVIYMLTIWQSRNLKPSFDIKFRLWLVAIRVINWLFLWKIISQNDNRTIPVIKPDYLIMWHYIQYIHQNLWKSFVSSLKKIPLYIHARSWGNIFEIWTTVVKACNFKFIQAKKKKSTWLKAQQSMRSKDQQSMRSKYQVNEIERSTVKCDRKISSRCDRKSKWMTDCCLTPNQQFFSHIMARTS
jgi:hypothetical protein